LYREPAPINETARAAIDGKRRLVAKIDHLGVDAPMMPIFCATQLSLVQAYVP
jgi:hypothetical protein